MSEGKNENELENLAQNKTSSCLSEETVVLASASRIRANLLRSAGLQVSVQPSGVDESTVKAALLSEHAVPAHIAETLAELKTVSRANTVSGFVVGADQVAVLDDVLLSKAETVSEATENLKRLSSKTHDLVSAVCLAKDGNIIWRHVARARLTMRPLSDLYIEHYLCENKQAALNCVGGYEIEGHGIQLFSKIEGDYFTILGLPLLPLLDILRRHQVLKT